MQVLKDRSFLDFNLKIFFKKYSYFRKCYLVISSDNKIISRNRKIGHSSIREDLDVDDMTNCAFIIFHNCNHCIKESITFPSGWFCSLYYSHELKNKWTIILIERNIGVRFFKPVQIIGWWTDTEYFINCNIFIVEIITDIQNPDSESMHIQNSNVDYEGVIIYHRTVGLVKINTLNLRTPIFTVVCNNYTCI